MSPTELQVAPDPLGRGVYINGVLYVEGQRLPPDIDVLQLLTVLSEQFPDSHEIAKRRRSFVNFKPFEL